MGEDVNALQQGGDAKFNMHLSTLEQINNLFVICYVDRVTHTGASLQHWYGTLEKIQAIVSPYINHHELSFIDSVKPHSFNSFVSDPFTGKARDGYNDVIASKLNAWECALYAVLAVRGLQLKAGDDPGHALKQGGK